MGRDAAITMTRAPRARSALLRGRRDRDDPQEEPSDGMRIHAPSDDWPPCASHVAATRSPLTIRR